MKTFKTYMNDQEFIDINDINESTDAVEKSSSIIAHSVAQMMVGNFDTKTINAMKFAVNTMIHDESELNGASSSEKNKHKNRMFNDLRGTIHKTYKTTLDAFPAES